MKTTRTHCLQAVAIMAGGLLLCACDKKPHVAANTENLPAAIVSVQPAEIQSRVATEEVVGTVRPKLSASISPKISGIIKEMAVVPGQQVKAGDLLVRLDDREIQARLDQAQAVREQSKKDMSRLDILRKEGAATQQEFDAAEARFRVADATVSENQTMLGYAKISAPFAGVITGKHADVGDLAAPGKALLEMEDPKTLRFEADVPDALISKIKMGDKLTVRVSPALTAAEATVSEITPIADPVSRTFRVKMDLPSSPELRSGQFGRVGVPVAQVNALHVPTNSVVLRGQMEMVFVITNQHAHMRLVKTGKTLNKSVEIVSGLNNGDQIVINGAAGLMDGQAVEVK